MRNFRRSYYNVFSRVYDAFVALHSGDAQNNLRRFLSTQVPVETGNRVLDICTGTGTLLSYLRGKVGVDGIVVGVDFSRGMLEVSRDKITSYKNIHLIECDVGFLPFRDNIFDAVTCSHAFYELKGETQDRVLKEIVRILKPGSSFLMMEHDVPESPIIRFLFYVRLFSMGAKRAVSILRHEQKTLGKYFDYVKKINAPGGKSKIMVCHFL